LLHELLRIARRVVGNLFDLDFARTEIGDHVVTHARATSQRACREQPRGRSGAHAGERPHAGRRQVERPRGTLHAMTLLLLARHGETDWNREGRWQGHANVPLNERGREQARELAQRLAGVAIDVIYASDLARAHETALIVAEDRRM